MEDGEGRRKKEEGRMVDGGWRKGELRMENGKGGKGERGKGGKGEENKKGDEGGMYFYNSTNDS